MKRRLNLNSALSSYQVACCQFNIRNLIRSGRLDALDNVRCRCLLRLVTVELRMRRAAEVN